MTGLKAAIAVAFVCTSVTAHAQGTEEQRAACRPDVRKFCRAVHPDAGSQAFLSCLQANRLKISAKCRQVIDGSM